MTPPLEDQSAIAAQRLPHGVCPQPGLRPYLCSVPQGSQPPAEDLEEPGQGAHRLLLEEGGRGAVVRCWVSSSSHQIAPSRGLRAFLEGCGTLLLSN